MRRFRALTRWLVLVGCAAVTGTVLVGAKVIPIIAQDMPPASVLTRDALVISKAGETLTDSIVGFDHLAATARGGQGGAAVVRDLSDQLLTFSMAQLHRLASSHWNSAVLHPSPARIAGSGATSFAVQQTATPAAPARSDCFDYGAAQEIVVLTNAERAKAGLPSLAIDESLMALARKRSSELVQDFSHARLRSECALCGENISWLLAGIFSPASQVAGWMNSPHGHRKNMLYPTARRVGVGVCRAADGRVYSALDILN
jgi:uncharacterized protein YkwD